MRLAVDTNVLIRAVLPVTDDTADSVQSRVAGQLLREADVIVVSLPTFCEFEWVLRSIYKFSPTEIGSAIRALLAAKNVLCDRRPVSFGLQVLAQGGDFADGLIAEAGLLAGAERFVSFDRRAVKLLGALGRSAELPS